MKTIYSCLVLVSCLTGLQAFVLPQSASRMMPKAVGPSSSWSMTVPITHRRRSTTPTTQLRLLLDVPDGFFTASFFMMGILLSISKNFARIRMEENAWEQRLASARKEQLRADPTLTELDLRRQEAALEWSAYGKPRLEEERQLKEGQRVKVMEREGYMDDDVEDDRKASSSRRRAGNSSDSRMTDTEIQAFELEYGIQYDPYYDEPYTEDELPTDVKYQTDKRYGDRIYENGEIFYRHDDLYYRQGAKPRNFKFWE